MLLFDRSRSKQKEPPNFCFNTIAEMQKKKKSSHPKYTQKMSDEEHHKSQKKRKGILNNRSQESDVLSSGTGISKGVNSRR
jgi:hypothetical protein